MFKNMKRFIPAFIPLFYQLFKHFRRDLAHDGNIRKKDKTAEKLSTVEHLLVKMERKVQQNRQVYEKLAKNIMIWLLINSLLLIAILVKLFIIV